MNNKLIFILVLTLFGLVACHSPMSSQSQHKKNILIISVDKLAFSSSTCRKELHDYSSGFNILCAESLRFTHAYTNSTLTAPAFASLMTGLLPWEIDFRYNSDFLRASFETLAEKAVKTGWRTGLVIGSPPLLRKQGLHQGFQFFDDNIQPRPKLAIRQAKESVAILSNWLAESSEPFFASLQLSDLSFPNLVTVNERGENRAQSVESQLEEIDVQLFKLFTFLKQKKIWDNTWIFLHGLQGLDDPSELKSTSTQIALLIKPPQKPRDEGLNWSIDRHIALNEIGKIIEKIVNGDQQPSELDISSPSENSNAAPILSESTLENWQQNGTYKWSFRNNQFLVINGKNKLIYNTLADRAESSPLNISNRLTQTILNKNDEILKSSPQLALGKISFPNSPDHPMATKAFAELKDKNWSSLQSLALILKNADLDVFAKMMETQVLQSDFINPCLKSITTDAKTNLKQCTNKTAVALIEWMNNDNSENRKRAVKYYTQFLIDRNLQVERKNLNYVWEISPYFPQGPGVVDLIFNHPKFAKHKIQLMQDIR
jgi:hypothetical protein